MANRFTNLTTSKGFKALDLDEIMAVPLAKQAKHEAIEETADNLSALNPDVHESRKGYADQKINDINTELSTLSKRLGEEGFSPELARRMNQLKNKQISEFSSGQLGKDIAANQKIKAHKLSLDKDKTIDNDMKSKGFARAEAEYAETGVWNEFVGEKSINVSNKAMLYGKSMNAKTVAGMLDMSTNSEGFLTDGEFVYETLTKEHIESAVTQSLLNDNDVMRYLKQREELGLLEGTAEEEAAKIAKSTGVTNEIGNVSEKTKMLPKYAQKHLNDGSGKKNDFSGNWNAFVSDVSDRVNLESIGAEEGAEDLPLYDDKGMLDMTEVNSNALKDSYLIFGSSGNNSKITKEEIMYAARNKGKLKDGRSIKVEVKGYYGGADTTINLLDKDGKNIGTILRPKVNSRENADLRKVLNPIEGTQISFNDEANSVVKETRENNPDITTEKYSDKEVYNATLSAKRKSSKIYAQVFRATNPGNTFNSMTEVVLGDKERNAPGTYLSKLIFVPGIGRGKYDEIADLMGYDDIEEFHEAMLSARIEGFAPAAEGMPGAYYAQVRKKDGSYVAMYIAPDDNEKKAYRISGIMAQSLKAGEAFKKTKDYSKGIDLNAYVVNTLSMSRGEFDSTIYRTKGDLTQAELQSITGWKWNQEQFRSEAMFTDSNGIKIKVVKRSMAQEMQHVSNRLMSTYDATPDGKLSIAQSRK